MHKIVTQTRIRARSVYVSHCCAHQPGNKKCKKKPPIFTTDGSIMWCKKLYALMEREMNSRTSSYSVGIA